MAKKEGKELATVKVYLNTGIIAGLVGVGFVGTWIGRETLWNSEGI